MFVLPLSELFAFLAARDMCSSVDISPQPEVKKRSTSLSTVVKVCTRVPVFGIVINPSPTRTAFAASVWLNGKFIRSTYGKSTYPAYVWPILEPAIEETVESFEFPPGALVAGKDNIVTVLYDNMGLNETNDCEPLKFPRHHACTNDIMKGMPKHPSHLGVLGDISWLVAKQNSAHGKCKGKKEDTRGVH